MLSGHDWICFDYVLNMVWTWANMVGILDYHEMLPNMFRLKSLSNMKHGQNMISVVWQCLEPEHVQVLNIVKTWSVFKHVQTCFEHNKTWFDHVWPESDILSMLDHVQNMLRNIARTCSVHVVQYIVLHHRTGYWSGTWIGTLCIPIVSVYTNRPVMARNSCLSLKTKQIFGIEKHFNFSKKENQEILLKISNKEAKWLLFCRHKQQIVKWLSSYIEFICPEISSHPRSFIQSWINFNPDMTK